MSDTDDLKRIQKRLQDLGYYRGLIDGDWGTESQDAFMAAMVDAAAYKRTAPPLTPSTKSLKDEAAFFDMLRRGVLGPTLTQSEVDGVKAIMKAVGDRGHPLSWVAYELATPWLETGGRMQPVEEDLHYRSAARICEVWPSRFPTLASAQPYVGKPRELANFVYGGRMGNRPGTDDGYDHRGRGLPQITGRENYLKATTKLVQAGIQVDLIAHPELALRPDVAAFILANGMEEGWFTGRKLAGTLPATRAATVEEFVRSRPIINAMDRAREIADAAIKFQSALTAGRYS